MINRSKHALVLFIFIILIGINLNLMAQNSYLDGLNKNPPKLCTGIMGNGQNVWSHFASLAKIIEEVDIVDGLAGGSSAALTLFLYESILANPEIYKCGKKNCSSETIRRRVSLQLKSIEGLISENNKFDLIRGISPIYHFNSHLRKDKKLVRILDKLNDKGLSGKRLTQLFIQFLKHIDESPLKQFINPGFIKFIKNKKLSIKYRFYQIKKIFSELGSFNAASPDIFIRPGILNFDHIAEFTGLYGNFYAGRSHTNPNEQQLFFKKCAIKGKSWQEISKIKINKHKTCETLFHHLFDQSIKNIATHDRIDDKIGKYLYNQLVTTAVIMDQSYKEHLLTQEESFLKGRFRHYNMDFSKILFGYAGRKNVIKKASQVKELPGLKNQKFVGLPNLTWKDLIITSPAEPGLSNYQKINIKGNHSYNKKQGDFIMSLGGWSDPTPTQVLEKIGCEKNILITRRGTKLNFVRAVSLHLGMSDYEDRELYSFHDPESAISKAIKTSSAVWCTDWYDYNGFIFKDIRKLIKDAYEDSFFVLQNHSDKSYFTERSNNNLLRDTGPIGCYVQ